MADLYSYLHEIDQTVDQVLTRLPIHEDPWEVRFQRLLQEKKATLQNVLKELKKEEPEKDAVIKWLKIIYRDDETAKLNFHSWKRIALQDHTVDEDKLDKIEELLGHTKEELNEMAQHTGFLTEDDMRFIAPPLYLKH
ncbi:hypothetical protein [Lentibacillus sediminis]|uniref:hypothetical protein n=1 Tax=Lentibacillus sediminis TaxID=1940529 RepID=UPI000C1C18D3|nr:hypothetical protein [Lentibacillus sediminis]